MFASEDFFERHFPPRLRFGVTAEEIGHKSRLLTEARHLASLKEHGLSTLLFHQVAAIEHELALKPANAQGPSAEDRLISAASCYALSGDLPRSLEIFGGLSHLSDELRGFVRGLQVRRNSIGGLVDEIRLAFQERDKAALDSAIPDAIGLLSPRILWWAVYRVSRNSHEQIEALKKLIIAEPRHLPFHLLFESYLQTRPVEEHERYVIYLQAGFPDDFRPFVASARFAARVRHWARSAIDAERALELIRDDSKRALDQSASYVSLAYAEQAIAERQLGRPDRAEAIYSEARTLLPADAEIDTLYGLLLLDRQRTNEALEVFRRAAANPSRKSHWSLTMAGTILLQGGMFHEAMPFLERAANETDGEVHARVLNNLGVALLKLKQADRAKQVFAAAASFEPSLVGIRKGVGEAIEPTVLEIPQFREALVDASYVSAMADNEIRAAAA